MRGRVDVALSTKAGPRRRRFVSLRPTDDPQVEIQMHSMPDMGNGGIDAPILFSCATRKPPPSLVALAPTTATDHVLSGVFTLNDRDEVGAG